ncbi:MAG TPA: MFS transporter [Pseudonocardiaceae bacterium]|jgi:MFS family permease|nr:MFS transporter [Pseudonocardiaceae bacterium]
MSSSLRALKTRNYRLWVSGTVVSNTGTWVQRTSQDWLVLTELTHHSGLATGITTGLQFAPLMLFSAHAGVLADRLPKRKVLLCTQSIMGVSALLLGVLVVTHTVQLWHVFACALLLGCGTALDNPSRQAFVSEVVPRADVPSAVSLNSASMNISRLIGPGVAGLIIAAWGTGPGFLINAASFAAVLIALTRMRQSEMYVSNRLPRKSGQVREGLRYVRQRPDLILIFAITGLVCTFAYNWQITNALMASGAFHRGPREYGLLGSAMAVGCLTAALLNARRERPRIALVIWAVLGLGVTMTLGALVPSYLTYAIALVPIGLCSITYLNSANTSVQLTTEARFRGRVLALYVALQQGTTPIGAPIVGWLGSEFGARWSVIVGGLSAVVAGLLGALVLRWKPVISSEYASAMRACAAESTLTVPVVPEQTAEIADVDALSPDVADPRAHPR